MCSVFGGVFGGVFYRVLIKASCWFKDGTRRQSAGRPRGFSLSFHFPLKTHFVSIYDRIPTVADDIYGASFCAA
jgi:hypothetical protein